MRLIDIDDWKNNNDAFIGLGLELDIDRVVETLNQMPTVDAIPIEWINTYVKHNFRYQDEREPILQMLHDWRKENEID